MEIKSQFNNNYVDLQSMEEAGVEMPYIFCVSQGKVLDKDGKVLFEGDIIIANMNGLKLSARDDQ